MKIQHLFLPAFLTLLFSTALPSATQAREIVRGVVSFDEPPGYRGFGPHNDPGDNPFKLSRIIVHYQPDEKPRGSFRQFSIGIGVVGYEIGEGKRIIYHKLGVEDLKRELARAAGDRSAMPSVIREGSVSGHKAYIYRTSRPTPSLRADAVLWTETYYVPFEDNRGVTLMLVADTEPALDAMRELLTRITIPADAHVIPTPPPPERTIQEKKRDQIVSNLRMITGAGEQCVLRSGFKKDKFTLNELRKEFGAELAALKPIDGENYESLVWESGKALRVETKTLGVVEFGP